MKKFIFSALAISLTLMPAAAAHASTHDHSDQTQSARGRKAPARRAPKDTRKARRKARARQAVAAYTCPMHEDVRSKTPGECPKCGMDLERKGAEQQKVEGEEAVEAATERP